MKTASAPYGSLKLSAQRTREIQLEWDMVEASPLLPRFLNFPCFDVVGRAARRRSRRSEKRPLAA